MRITVGQRQARLARRQFLDRPAPSVEAVADALAGLHSSDPITVFLSCWARITDFTPPVLEEALYERRSLLRLLGMRRTMFVVPPDLGRVMNAACTRVLAPRERARLVGQIEGQGLVKNGARWLRKLERDTLAALSARGEATARELSEDVSGLRKKLHFGEGKAWAGSTGISTRVLFLLATDGRIVRARPLGSWRSSQYRWATVEDWCGEIGEMDPQAARADLVRRWLASYGPGTETDLRWWSGLTAREVRAAVHDVGAVDVALDDGPGLILPGDEESPTDPRETVALLPGLDPAIMGWKERAWVLPDGEHGLFDRNGNAGPTVWAGGRVVGGWAQRESGEIVTRLIADVGAEAEQAITRRAERLEAWLGEHRVTTRFPSPLEKELKS